MSSVKIEGNASGTGIFTIASPNSNTNRTLTIPDATTTIVGTDATQTLTNKTLGSGLVMGTSAITSDTAKSSTSGTNIDFTGIPSWAKQITLMLNGVSWNATVGPLIQLGTSSGVETTGYTAICGSTSTTSVAGAGTSTTGFGLQAGWDAVVLFTGSITFSLINSSTNTWVAQGVVFADWTTDYCLMIAGVKSLSATLDRVRVTSTGGTTFDAGTINILYG